MADISQFTSVFYTQPGSDAAKVTKRSRATLSCLDCHARKLKCDRRQPCGACVKRGDHGACKYLPRPGTGSGNATSGPPGRRQDAHTRLQKLERMAEQLANAAGTAQPWPSPGPVPKEQTPSQGATGASSSSRSSSSQHPASDPSGPRSADSLSVGTDTVYHGTTHWAAFLDHIREIQVVLDTETQTSTVTTSPLQQSLSPYYNNSPDILFGNLASLTMEGVMDSLPSRRESDKLVSFYFNSKFTTVPFIHVHQFQRQYQAFWEDPSATSFMWISILFSILCIASIVPNAKGCEESTHLELRDPSFFMGKAAKSLVAGQYLTNKKYAIEALLIHAHTRNNCSKNSDPVLWAIFGFTTRLAQRSGYHRDPTSLPQRFSPFETEMRRRTWFSIEVMDLLLSCQLGMPPVVHYRGSNTDVPSNYSDDDFDEDTVVMPPPRPPIDPTPSLYYRTKGKLCRILRKVMQQVLYMKQPSYLEAQALNDELHLWYAGLPASLSIRPIRTTSFNDQNYTIMYRIILEMVYRKALCLLHRPYLTFEKENRLYAPSRDICRDSALKLLDLHTDFDREIKAGGRMYEDRYMLSSCMILRWLPWWYVWT
ncbi:hypothetical protein QQX98_000405 [Neonectria punicea]|uniref:Zn(2)-C6 fungal-type domain-containing protein n=1 Tax=Neonectria punicea TaxID=979145 RepID=A0ABR1HT94_9HYPO